MAGSRCSTGKPQFRFCGRSQAGKGQARFEIGAERELVSSCCLLLLAAANCPIGFIR